MKRIVFAALAMMSVSVVACSRGPKAGAGAPGAPAVVPGSPDCYKTTGALACPKDSSDLSGLPKTGAVCMLPVCQSCGSDKAPAYRDSAGAPQTGWCICVEKSDGSGVRIYSCGQHGWGAN